MRDRREFIKTLARGGILATLTGLSGLLLKRRAGGDACRQDFTCGSCSSSGGCRLPEADHFRLERAKRNNSANHGAGAGR